MTKKFLSKYFLSAINDSTALAQVFVVILFFENYLIAFQNTSLFRLAIDFENIELAPFIWFFIFIAGFKVFWWVFHFLLTQIKPRLNWFTTGKPLSSRVHFLSFLLVWLIGFYFYNINKDDHAFAPFDVEQHNFLFNLFQLPGIAAFGLGGLIILFADIKYEDEN